MTYIRDFYVPEIGCGTLNITKEEVKTDVIRDEKEKLKR